LYLWPQGVWGYMNLAARRFVRFVGLGPYLRYFQKTILNPYVLETYLQRMDVFLAFCFKISSTELHVLFLWPWCVCCASSLLHLSVDTFKTQLSTRMFSKRTLRERMGFGSLSQTDTDRADVLFLWPRCVWVYKPSPLSALPRSSSATSILSKLNFHVLKTKEVRKHILLFLCLKSHGKQ
jgi:hypothetical protein